jgi:hypothetical protein
VNTGSLLALWQNGGYEARTDALFIGRLAFIEQAAGDERNLVKKAVSWALRAIGERNAALHAQAVALASGLASSPAASARWIGGTHCASWAARQRQNGGPRRAWRSPDAASAQRLAPPLDQGLAARTRISGCLSS